MTGLGCFKQTKKVDRYILGSNHEFKCEEIVNGTLNQSYNAINMYKDLRGIKLKIL